MAEGTTTIEYAACEPEVQDLANFLNKAGAKITGIGENKLTIEGVRELHGVDYEIIPDRIEAGTFMIAGAITRGDITLENARPEHLGAVIDKLREIGVEITPHAVFQINRLADVDDRPFGIAIQITARLGGQGDKNAL